MKTLPMGVENTAFLLQRLSSDCGPVQYLRELTQNSIEAIQRKGGSGNITWTFDDHAGVRKLRIVDTGDGMTAEEMQRYLNHLSSSGGRQGFDANYGVGAKISAVARNPFGVVYMSWKSGDGHMLRTWRDPDTGEFGLAPMENGEHVVRLRAQARPTEIADTGTAVTLLGASENDDTFSANSIIPSRGKGQWIRKYLNTRYFRLPPGISIDCQTASQSDEGMRYVSGMGPMLDAICFDSGEVALTEAMVFWWIIPKEGSELAKPVSLAGGKQIRSMKSFQPSHFYRGHVAALYRDELYDVLQGRTARTWLQDAGVTFGYDQVVVYIKPIESRIMTDTARTRLMLDGGAMPWSEWQEEFRDVLPKAIRDLVERSAPRDEGNAEVDQRILSIAHLFQSPRAKPQSEGAFDTGSPDAGVEPRTKDETKPPKERPKKPPTRPRPGFAYGDLVDTGEPADEATPRAPSIPRVRWVSAKGETPTRAEDEFPEYAAWYVPSENTIKANWDFVVFGQLQDVFVNECGGRPGAVAASERAIRSWYEQTLKETVMGLRALVGYGEWTLSTFRERLTGDQGAALLTAAAMPRYSAQQFVRHQLGNRLGRLKD